VEWFSLISNALILTFLAYYNSSYLQEKAKNRAMREDVRAITEQVESVKTEFAKQLQSLQHSHEKLLEKSRQSHQLSLAAIDKRLEKHQEAFTLTWDLMKISLRKDQQQYATHAEKMRAWRKQNNLYLSKNLVELMYRVIDSATIDFDKGDISETSTQLINKMINGLLAALELAGIAQQLERYDAEGKITGGN
jgi:hypothetical protein